MKSTTRRDQQAATRERILDAAATIVRDQGVAAATTRRIAAEAGVSEGSLYNHFSDKPQLLTTLVLERLPSIKGVFEDLYGGEADVSLRDRLSKALAAMIAFYIQAQPILGGITSDPHLLGMCRRRFAETGEGPQNAHEKLAAFLRLEQEGGRVRPNVNPSALAYLMIGACTEYASLTNLTGSEPIGLAERDYVRAILDTIAPLLES